MLMPEAEMHHPPPGMDPERMENNLWEAVKDTNSESALNSYLKKYPDGMFAAAARARIEALNAKAVTLPVQACVRRRRGEAGRSSTDGP